MRVKELAMSRIPDGMTMSEHDRRNNLLYLVLITYYEGDDSDEPKKEWEYCRGTQTAFDYAVEKITENIESDEAVDLENSYILVASPKIHLDNPLPLYNFLKNCVDKKHVVSDGFNIDEYYDSDDNMEREGDIQTNEIPRYGQGENPVQYTSQDIIDGGEV